jgi:hypothetical protein
LTDLVIQKTDVPQGPPNAQWNAHRYGVAFDISIGDDEGAVREHRHLTGRDFREHDAEK